MVKSLMMAELRRRTSFLPLKKWSNSIHHKEVSFFKNFPNLLMFSSGQAPLPPAHCDLASR